MELPAPKNPNYAATVVQVRHINQLEGCDFVVGVPLLGYQAIVSKDVKIGDLGIVFTAETQLSERFASENNLYRHSHLNKDPGKKGYLEDNRRVKAVRFRGHTSNALFMPLESLAWTGVDVTALQEGDTFDTLNGHEICRKYVVRTPGSAGQLRPAPLRVSRVDDRFLPKHFDTENYFRNVDRVGWNEPVVVTQKLHGTSVRIGHTLVKRKLSWLERLAKRLGIKVQETEYAYVYGSRNVIKDPDNPFEREFYGSDIYTAVGSRLKGLLPKGFVVYGEIVGWVGDRPIQPGYTYQIPKGEARLFVYRVARVSEDGYVTDLSWEQVKAFCQSIGVDTVPELWVGKHFNEELARMYLDRRLFDLGFGALPTEPGQVDEGICIRQNGLIPTIYKAKSPKFLEYETKQLDKGAVDIEAAEAEEVAA